MSDLGDLATAIVVGAGAVWALAVGLVIYWRRDG